MSSNPQRLSFDGTDFLISGRIEHTESQENDKTLKSDPKNLVVYDYRQQNTDVNSSISISPRDKLSYESDRKVGGKFERDFIEHGRLESFQRLLILFNDEIIKNKPDDIIEYAINNFFHPENQSTLKEVRYYFCDCLDDQI